MDKEYWDRYYNKLEAPEEPSEFARFVLSRFAKAGDSLFELGCGNGRDAMYFNSHGVDITAVDQSEFSINNLSTNNSSPTLSFIKGDFSRLNPIYNKLDIVYSRFTLHSVSEDSEDRVINWSVDALKSGGVLCVEARGRKNSLYHMGSLVTGQEDAFIYDDHYRRFIDINVLRTKLANVGLRSIISLEDTGFAPFNGEDDYFVRQISQKA